MQLTPFTNYASRLNDLKGYAEYITGYLDDFRPAINGNGDSKMLCTTTDVIDRQLAFSKMMEEGYTRVLFTPDPESRPEFDRLFYATDHHPKDPDWVRMVSVEFPGELIVLHIDPEPGDLEKDVFLQHSERVLHQTESPVQFRLMHGSDPVNIILDSALKDNIDLLFIPCSGRAMLKSVAGEGFTHQLLDRSTLPVIVFKD